MNQLHLAQPGEVDHIWPDIAASMRSACERGGGDITGAYLLGICRSGQAFLWVGYDDLNTTVSKAAAVVRFGQYGGEYACEVLAMGGEGFDWQWALSEIDIWARSLGAAFTWFEGRRGFEKILTNIKPIATKYKVMANG